MHTHTGGVLIFGVVFIEWFFVLQTVWFHQFYYYFGFLSATFGLLLIATAEVSIFLVFAQLCAEVGCVLSVRVCVWM